MRFALAVIVAAVTQAYLYAIPGVIVLTAILYVALAALAAGFLARRRGWLAGALSVLLGVAIYGIITLLGPNAVGETPLDMLQSETALILAIVPYAIVGAVAGAAGEWLRRRVLARR